MASQALYRKWRSQTFDQLIGQEHVVRTLRNAISEGRVAHAYLFTGPRGVGKTTMARLLAKAVNCTAPMDQRPCGICESCQAIANGHAVDVIEMDAASHTSVDDAREIIERVQFRPTSGRYKVYVIDEVHMLSTAAFNALLKTLEEPPEHAIFILATTEVHKVPATILSRCQRFTFTRLGIAAMADHLRQIAAEEGLQLEPGVAEAIARAATGSMRDALGILEQSGSFSDGTITLAQVHSLLGMTAAVEVDALIEALLAGNLPAGLRAINGMADQGADLRQFARDLVERLRALLLLVVTHDPALLDVGEDELTVLNTWASHADAGQLVAWIKIFSSLDYQLRTSPYGHLPLELAMVEALIAPAPATNLPSPVANRLASRPRAASPPVATAAAARSGDTARPSPVSSLAADRPDAAPPATDLRMSDVPDAVSSVSIDAPDNVPHDDLLPPIAAPSSVSPATTVVPEIVHVANTELSILEQVEAVWSDVVRDVRPRDKMVQALLHSIRPLDVEDRTVILLAPSQFHKENIEKPHHRQIVEEVLSKHMGMTFGIRCTIEVPSEPQDMRSQMRASRKDAWVKAAINVFDADIIDIEQ